jgi:hypothetical protein
MSDAAAGGYFGVEIYFGAGEKADAGEEGAGVGGFDIVVVGSGCAGRYS